MLATSNRGLFFAIFSVGMICDFFVRSHFKLSSATKIQRRTVQYGIVEGYTWHLSTLCKFGKEFIFRHGLACNGWLGEDHRAEIRRTSVGLSNY